LYHFSAGSVGSVPFEEACVPLIVNREDRVTENNGTFEVKSTETDQVNPNTPSREMIQKSIEKI
jgi:hypothetical protein